MLKEENFSSSIGKYDVQFSRKIKLRRQILKSICFTKFHQNSSTDDITEIIFSRTFLTILSLPFYCYIFQEQKIVSKTK
jgi:hypothetical protein